MELSDFEFRACRDREELKRYNQVVQYVFASSREDVDAEVETTLPEWTMCAFQGERLVATMGTFPFTVRLNGAPVKMGGVTAVGTLPEFRRRGLLRRIMSEGLRVMKDREQPLAILWASMGAIYQRFGYGLASAQVVYEFDPRYVSFESGPEPRGRVALMPKDDAWPIIKQLYIEYSTRRNLHIHRSAALWNLGTLRPEKNRPVYIGIYRDESGEPRGYIIYTTEEREQGGFGPGQVMQVRDFVPLDMDAYRGMWNYIRGHDLVGKAIMWGKRPEDDPAPELLLEPRMLNRRTHDGIWMRVVDIESALPKRPFGDRGELVLRVRGDDMCPWNEGTYLLETDGPSAAVRRTDRSPELTMPVNTLASLIAGYRPATHFERAGLLEAADDRALKTADRLFRAEYAPSCPDGF